MKGKFISYVRVSTERQGRSGLGLDAQRQAVERYLNGGSWELLHEYREIESGKRDDRPEMARALRHARSVGATVVFAKLDRLARNTRLLLEIVDSGADVVFCDLPHIPPGPTGRFILTQMAAVAELERGLISERTKAALAAAKARGQRLGNPNGAAVLRAYVAEHGNGQAIEAVRTNAQARAEGLRWAIEELLAAGITSDNAMARDLNDRVIRTPRNGSWTPTSVRRLRDRLSL